MFLCKQKTAYEMRISDLSSDVCSSDRFGDQRLPFGYRVGIAVAGDHLGARREHGARIATGAEGRIDMALARRNGERGDDLFAKHGIVAGVAGKLAHLRPFPFVSAQWAARRRSTGSASTHSASVGSHQISKRRPEPTKAVAPASPMRSRAVKLEIGR